MARVAVSFRPWVNEVVFSDGSDRPESEMKESEGELLIEVQVTWSSLSLEDAQEKLILANINCYCTAAMIACSRDAQSRRTYVWCLIRIAAAGYWVPCAMRELVSQTASCLEFSNMTD